MGFKFHLGLHFPSKIAPKTFPGAPKWPQDGVQTVPWTSKMAIQASPEPSKPPSWPSKPQFWPPGAHFASHLEVPSVILDAQRSIFQPPGTHFPAQTSLCPSPPCLQTSNPPKSARRNARSVWIFLFNRSLLVISKKSMKNQKIYFFSFSNWNYLVMELNKGFSQSVHEEVAAKSIFKFWRGVRKCPRVLFGCTWKRH